MKSASFHTGRFYLQLRKKRGILNVVAEVMVKLPLCFHRHGEITDRELPLEHGKVATYRATQGDCV